VPAAERGRHRNGKTNGSRGQFSWNTSTVETCDGGLRYGRENILATYYTAHLWRGIFVAPDLQYVSNPEYNRDRGPAVKFQRHGSIRWSLNSRGNSIRCPASTQWTAQSTRERYWLN